jgi:hypothetical protein
VNIQRNIPNANHFFAFSSPFLNKKIIPGLRNFKQLGYNVTWLPPRALAWPDLKLQNYASLQMDYNAQIRKNN